MQRHEPLHSPDNYFSCARQPNRPQHGSGTSAHLVSLGQLCIYMPGRPWRAFQFQCALGAYVRHLIKGWLRTDGECNKLQLTRRWDRKSAGPRVPRSWIEKPRSRATCLAVSTGLLSSEQPHILCGKCQSPIWDYLELISSEFRWLPASRGGIHFLQP